MTTHSKSWEGSPITKLIDKKHGVWEIVFLSLYMQERRRRISAVSTAQRDIEN